MEKVFVLLAVTGCDACSNCTTLNCGKEKDDLRVSRFIKVRLVAQASAHSLLQAHLNPVARQCQDAGYGSACRSCRIGVIAEIHAELRYSLLASIVWSHPKFEQPEKLIS
jgi:hypothetical protein